MSVDPYMRGRMDDLPSYAPPWQLGQPADGAAVGEVVASQAPELPVGCLVLHPLGWREYALVPARQADGSNRWPGCRPRVTWACSACQD